MQTETIRLDVPPEVARRFREATPEQRARATAALAHAVMSREEAVEAFHRIASTLSAEARENGLTEEGLQALLDEDA